jgi:hypothetical protein
MQYHLFVVTPVGQGIDTPRLWEALNMKCIPNVLTSPLDRLYEDYPIAIINSWDLIFDISYLEHLKSTIQNKFGIDPFTIDVMNRLSLDYWVEKIQKQANYSIEF